jgi:hypothetical protein
LAFHFKLCDETPSPAYLWVDCGLDDVNKKVIAAYMGVIRKNKNNIPYGLDVDGNCFDRDTGEYIEQPLGKGLTCATFIMAIFGRFGFRLLKTEEWPERAEDIQWQQQILEVLEAEGASADHVAAARKDIGTARFRPEEVGGAVSETLHPVGFERVREIVEEIMAMLGRNIEAH